MELFLVCHWRQCSLPLQVTVLRSLAVYLSQFCGRLECNTTSLLFNLWKKWKVWRIHRNGNSFPPLWSISSINIGTTPTGDEAEFRKLRQNSPNRPNLIGLINDITSTVTYIVYSRYSPKFNSCVFNETGSEKYFNIFFRNKRATWGLRVGYVGRGSSFYLRPETEFG